MHSGTALLFFENSMHAWKFGEQDMLFKMSPEISIEKVFKNSLSNITFIARSVSDSSAFYIFRATHPSRLSAHLSLKGAVLSVCIIRTLQFLEILLELLFKMSFVMSLEMSAEISLQMSSLNII